MLPIPVTAKLVRVFYDRSQIHPWSVDTGAGTAEINVKEVFIEGLTGKFVANTSVTNPEPKAWVQFENVELVVWLDGAKISIKHSLATSDPKSWVLNKP